VHDLEDRAAKRAQGGFLCRHDLYPADNELEPRAMQRCSAPAKYELVINDKAANALALSVPPSLLARGR